MSLGSSTGSVSSSSARTAPMRYSSTRTLATSTAMRRAPRSILVESLLGPRAGRPCGARPEAGGPIVHASHGPAKWKHARGVKLTPCGCKSCPTPVCSGTGSGEKRRTSRWLPGCPPPCRAWHEGCLLIGRLPPPRPVRAPACPARREEQHGRRRLGQFLEAHHPRHGACGRHRGRQEPEERSAIPRGVRRLHALPWPHRLTSPERTSMAPSPGNRVVRRSPRSNGGRSHVRLACLHLGLV